MEEETSETGLKAQAESRPPGHCMKQAEETIREKFQQNTNKEYCFSECILRNHLHKITWESPSLAYWVRICW